jgi:hypothetical protein
LGRSELLANWCDRTFGTQIAEQINREMIKWCEAFLDEGHATWAMPHREQGFYNAWKILARREWSPCGVDNSSEKIIRLPSPPEDALLESLTTLGIEPEAWHDYLALHLAALSGWAGLIKWRADQTEYDWQRAYPIDLLQYLAVRLWYERELVQQICDKQLGTAGSVPAISAKMKARSAALKPSPSDKRPCFDAAWSLTAVVRALLENFASLMAALGATLTVTLTAVLAVPGAVQISFESGTEPVALGFKLGDLRLKVGRGLVRPDRRRRGGGGVVWGAV